jgi:hypothetical protein
MSTMLSALRSSFIQASGLPKGETLNGTQTSTLPEIRKNKIAQRCPMNDFFDFQTFCIPPILAVRDELEFFNSHAIFQQLIG